MGYKHQQTQDHVTALCLLYKTPKYQCCLFTGLLASDMGHDHLNITLLHEVVRALELSQSVGIGGHTETIYAYIGELILRPALMP